MKKLYLAATGLALALTACSRQEIEDTLKGAQNEVATKAATVAAESLGRLLSEEAARSGLPVTSPTVLEAVRKDYIGAEIGTPSEGRIEVKTLGEYACLTFVTTPMAVSPGRCAPLTTTEEPPPSR